MAEEIPATSDPLPAPASPPPAAAPAVASRPARRPARNWGFFVWLLIVALLAGGGTWLYRLTSTGIGQLQEQQDTLARLVRDLNAVEAQAARVEARQSDLAAVTQRSSAQLAEFGSRIDEHDEVVGRLNEQFTGGRTRFQLAAVEQLLLLANDRVQLARDARSAAIALQAADERLAALADPRLFKLREAIALERSALLAVPEPDFTAAALTLGSLLARAARLPLAARVPDRFDAPADLDPPADAPALWWQRVLASVRRALQGTFAVRRSTGPTPRLLPPEQEALVHQVLELKLEGARVALLRGDTAAFRDLTGAAADWLKEQFRREDASVLAALAELERLQQLELSPPLPDISQSLALLRAQLEPAPQ